MYKESAAEKIPVPMPKKPRPPYIEHGNAEKFNQKVIKPWFDMQPKESEFLDIYPQSEISRNLDYLRKRKKRFEKKTDKAKIAEFSLLQGFGDEFWLPEASVVPCSEYDDIARGVDFVITFEENGEFNHLGIDATTGGLSDYLEKIDRIRNDFKKGKLRQIKYFEADEPEIEKGRLNIPVVILRIDPYKTRELMQTMSKNVNDRTRDEVLFLENFRSDVIEEIKEQLKEEIDMIKKEVPGKDPKKKKLIKAHERVLKEIEKR